MISFGHSTCFSDNNLSVFLILLFSFMFMAINLLFFFKLSIINLYFFLYLLFFFKVSDNNLLVFIIVKVNEVASLFYDNIVFIHDLFFK